jgi:hypothetical protein
LDDLFGVFPDFSIRLDEVRELGDRTLGAARISRMGRTAWTAPDP